MPEAQAVTPVTPAAPTSGEAVTQDQTVAPESLSAKKLAELAEHDRFVRKFRKEFETVKPHAEKWTTFEAKKAEGFIPAIEHAFGKEFVIEHADALLDYIATHGRAPSPEQLEAKKAEDEKAKFKRWQEEERQAEEAKRAEAAKAELEKGRSLVLKDVESAFSAEKYPFVARIGADAGRIRKVSVEIYKATGAVPSGADILDKLEEIYSGVPRSSGTEAPKQDAKTAPATQGKTAPPKSNDAGTKLQTSTMTDAEIDADIRRRLRENEAKRRAAHK